MGPAPPDADDRDLVRAAASGDARAFEELYRRHRDFVLRLARRFGLGEQDALDVLQETFLYVCRALPRLELRASFTTFLYPAVKHLCLKRKGFLARFLPSGRLFDEEPGVPEPAVAPRGADDFPRLVAGLPDGQREVVLLRFVDGMEIAEIAAALGIPPGTVKSRLHNALNRLRETVGK
ncbi:MAG TPA: sigma-70 family RNA polymerase sigma factor [bacterium]